MRALHPRCCLGLEREGPRSARPARMDKPPVSTFGGPTRPRSPLRRCFKPRPPLSAGCAGFASGCQSSGFGAQATADFPPFGFRSLRSRSGRLSGLLSGCPPTGTRPQARAKLGNAGRNYLCRSMQAFFSSGAKIVSKSFAQSVVPLGHFAGQSMAVGSRSGIIRPADQ